jgi:hypothetical protein
MVVCLNSPKELWLCVPNFGNVFLCLQQLPFPGLDTLAWIVNVVCCCMQDNRLSLPKHHDVMPMLSKTGGILNDAGGSCRRVADVQLAGYHTRTAANLFG